MVNGLHVAQLKCLPKRLNANQFACVKCHLILVGCCLATKVFYREIAGCEMGVGDHRVGRWWKGSWANKIVARLLLYYLHCIVVTCTCSHSNWISPLPLHSSPLLLHTFPQAFTGDTLFVDSVGRPDLVGSLGHTAEEMAKLMFNTLQTKILTLPDDVQVTLPFCMYCE